MLVKSSLIAFAGLAGLAAAELREVWYNVTYVQANPDGQYERRAIGVNGTWPPPPLDVNVNDTVRVHVTNGLDLPTAIHHHGMFFNETSWYDGALAVTQCGIPPGRTLTYEIPVDTQHGTYWWHAHASGQYIDGLRAPFLIHPAVEAHSYDEEYTVVLGDWYHQEHEPLKQKFMGKYNPTGAEPVPEALLIYFAQNGTYIPGFNMNTSLSFEAGKTYRLRMINTSGFAMFFTWIDGHQMRVIEVDGTDVEEYPVDFVTLSVAQRYSVLVTAKETTDMNYLFHVNFDSTMFDVVPDGLQLNYTSIIEYSPTAAIAPEESREVLGLMTDELMVPLVPEAQLGPARTIKLGVWFDTFDNGENRAAFNNITYQMPEVPTIFSALSMGADASNTTIYGQQTHAFVLEKDEIIDLQVENYDANAHPFHLHGHKFQIVRVAQNIYTNDTELNPPHTEGAVNPMRRDTIIVPGDGGAVNIRFIADNPGVWFFHCHIEWHLVSGLAVVFIEAPTELQAQSGPPQEFYDQCSALNVPTSGNAMGRMSFDLTGQVLGPYPQILGWTPPVKGALAGTILAAVLGMIAVVWYVMGEQLESDDIEEEVQRELDAKAAKGTLVQRIRGKVPASS